MKSPRLTLSALNVRIKRISCWHVTHLHSLRKVDINHLMWGKGIKNKEKLGSLKIILVARCGGCLKHLYKDGDFTLNSSSIAAYLLAKTSVAIKAHDAGKSKSCQIKGRLKHRFKTWNYKQQLCTCFVSQFYQSALFGCIITFVLTLLFSYELVIQRLKPAFKLHDPNCRIAAVQNKLSQLALTRSFCESWPLSGVPFTLIKVPSALKRGVSSWHFGA